MRLNDSPDDPARTLIDDYLAEQQRLQTPVARFSQHHDAGDVSTPIWRDLIPLSTPKTGEQYAFEVNLDQCTGCKACVAGCHSLNGLDEEETWRDVGMIHGGTRAQPFQQTVTTACHHCADPGCLNGCPVLAYEKDPVTGIVRHLDDQCIGCQYCVLKCPYDVPKYSERLGIVRKCDMCHSRLGAGEAPACVQSCPTQAIRIVLVPNRKDGVVAADTSAFLPAPNAPDPAYTQPTTRYVSKRAIPENAQPVDAAVLRVQPAHWPLVFMLTLMPMSVGCVTAYSTHQDKRLLLGSWVAGALGLAASVFHLGQPLRAWRVFLGLRRSWLSREAVLFGAYFGALTTVTALLFLPLPAAFHFATDYVPLLAKVSVGIGIPALFCSVMIYVDTHRTFWRLAQTLPRFFGTAAVLALALGYALSPSASLAIALTAALLGKLAVETRCLRPLDDDDENPTPDRHTARLLVGPLRSATSLRYLTALAVLALTFAHSTGALSPAFSWAVLFLAGGSEFTERYLYFRAVTAPKMPGVVSK